MIRSLLRRRGGGEEERKLDSVGIRAFFYGFFLALLALALASRQVCFDALDIRADISVSLDRPRPVGQKEKEGEREKDRMSQRARARAREREREYGTRTEMGRRPGE